jgi:hypothetical protein
MSDSQKSRSWVSRFVRHRLVIVLAFAVIASGLGSTAAALASKSKAKAQAPVAVKGPPLGTFTTASGDSPTLPTAGTYFVVVKVDIQNSGDSPLVGDCGVTATTTGSGFSGFESAIVVAPQVETAFSLSGMAVVGQFDAPQTMQAACINETGQPVPNEGATWWVEKVNT